MEITYGERIANTLKEKQVVIADFTKDGLNAHAWINKEEVTGGNGNYQQVNIEIKN